ncbi:MAG: tetratricopeptide repeat protein [Chloroflexi bacterium]|nr:tetratricopeptide repeat protein [Chloroflexota bacterium]
MLLDEVFELLPNGYSSGSDIEPEAEELDSDVWWRKQILGKAYNNRGYLYWANGRYGVAFDDFRHALGYFRQIDLEDERANTLTNLAYVMALLGRVDTAKYHIERALEIRERLDKTRRYTIALSKNTRGLVYSMGDLFDIGIRECREALDICEEVKEWRGIGMARNALGFSLRRRGEEWKKGELVYTIESAETDFAEAEENLLRAIDIFSGPDGKSDSGSVTEPIRLWEAHNELGSLYCDWAYLTRQQKDLSRAAIQYKDSIAHQKKALEIAEEKNLSFQITDSHDDLAQAYRDYGDLLIDINDPVKAASYRTEAEKYLTKIEAELIPKEYQLKEAGTDFSDTALLSESGVAYWQSLGRVYLQRGVWEAHKLERREVTFGERPESTRRCIRYLAISFVYFQQYGPQSSHVDKIIWAFTRRLDSFASFTRNGA